MPHSPSRRSRVLLCAALLALVSLAPVPRASRAQAPPAREAAVGRIRHVLLLSIDGMHAIDLQRCARSPKPYCPHLAALAAHGIRYTQAFSTKPSDSFPGLTALVTGGSPRSTGAFYDVSYDRSLSPPAATSPYGIVGGPGLCPRVHGTQVAFARQIDYNSRRLDAGGGIDPAYLPRDPRRHCAPVYPHDYIRVNTLFEVVRAAGGYTAWSDKHPSYELVEGPSGRGVDDFYAPEIDSRPVPLPQVKRMRCDPLPDRTAIGPKDSWTDSFANVRCYDSLKVRAILNEIDGRNHEGTQQRPVPTVFGMDFQAVNVGEKLIEHSTHQRGGYLDADGTPGAALRGEIQFVDASIGAMVRRLRQRGLLSSTAIIVTAKHGNSPIDPARLRRIPHDRPADLTPAALLSPRGVGPGRAVVQADEDDISVLWLAHDTPAVIHRAVVKLEANAARIGAEGGEIFYGQSLDLQYGDPAVDPRTPDIIVAPDVGVVYTAGDSKLAEHGGFAHDDRNVLLLVSNPALPAATLSAPVSTMQVAPTILRLLGLDPRALKAVREQGTQVLPGLFSPHAAFAPSR